MCVSKKKERKQSQDEKVTAEILPYGELYIVIDLIKLNAAVGRQCYLRSADDQIDLRLHFSIPRIPA